MKGTTSLKRILAVLEVFSEKHLEWTPEELLAELGYSRPTLYRYLKYLKEAGFLISTPGAGFTLGPKVVELDYLMRKADSLVLNGTPYLKGLTATYPCTALLVRWYGNKILCVASKPPRSIRSAVILAGGRCRWVAVRFRARSWPFCPVHA